MTEDTDNTFDPKGLTRMEAEHILQAFEQMVTSQSITFPKSHARITEAMRNEIISRMMHGGRVVTLRVVCKDGDDRDIKPILEDALIKLSDATVNLPKPNPDNED